MLVAFVAACEVAFWVLLALALLARYGLRLRRVSTALLVCVPLVDVVLLVATIVDLRRGGDASPAHALAAIYIGVSVAGGHRMIAWADRQVAYRLAGGPKPERRPKRGVAHARAERAGWYRHALAWTVGCALLLLASLLVGDWHRAEALTDTIGLWSAVWRSTSSSRSATPCGRDLSGPDPPCSPGHYGMIRRRRRSAKMSRNMRSVSTNSWNPNRRALLPSANMS